MRPSFLPRTCRTLGGLLSTACLVMPAMAVEFTGSGFATFAVGRTSGGCSVSGLGPSYSDSCTRYVADWSHAGVYTDRWSAKPETRLGLQGTARVDSQLSATAQVMARPLPDQHASLEWLYLTYQPTPEWSLQVGRKRLPLYFYSDFQDVGYSYNTVRPSPDVYGWDIVNYNGVSLSRTMSLGDWTLRAEGMYGNEVSRNNKVLSIFVPTPVKAEWRDIVGLNAEVSRDWFTARLSYTDFRHRISDQTSGAVLGEGGPRHRLVGLALNGDIGPWTVRSEFGTATRRSSNFGASFYLANVGYRIGDFTLTGGTSFYRETLLDTGALSNRHRVLTGTLRYEVHKGGALKLQLDQQNEHTPGPALQGDARVWTATYDVIF